MVQLVVLELGLSVTFHHVLATLPMLLPISMWNNCFAVRMSADPSGVEQKSHCELREGKRERERGERSRRRTDGRAQKDDRAGQQERVTWCDTGRNITCCHMSLWDHILVCPWDSRQTDALRETLVSIYNSKPQTSPLYCRHEGYIAA